MLSFFLNAGGNLSTLIFVTSGILREKTSVHLSISSMSFTGPPFGMKKMFREREKCGIKRGRQNITQRVRGDGKHD